MHALNRIVYMYVCYYVKIYFMTLASSILVGFHAGHRFVIKVFT